jgi:hypothetical protein
MPILVISPLHELKALAVLKGYSKKTKYWASNVLGDQSNTRYSTGSSNRDSRQTKEDSNNPIKL